MQIATKTFATTVMVLLLFVACSTSGPTKAAWVELNKGQVVPSASTRIERIDIYELDSSDEVVAAEWLQSQNMSSVALQELPTHLIRVNANKTDDPNGVYLVRAVSDKTPGVFTAYADHDGVLVLYNHFGSCGDLERRVVAIRLKNRPLKVYGGCSGAL